MSTTQLNRRLGAAGRYLAGNCSVVPALPPKSTRASRLLDYLAISLFRALKPQNRNQGSLLSSTSTSPDPSAAGRSSQPYIRRLARTSSVPPPHGSSVFSPSHPFRYHFACLCPAAVPSHQPCPVTACTLASPPCPSLSIWEDCCGGKRRSSAWVSAVLVVLGSATLPAGSSQSGAFKPLGEPVRVCGE